MTQQFCCVQRCAYMSWIALRCDSGLQYDLLVSLILAALATEGCWASLAARASLPHYGTLFLADHDHSPHLIVHTQIKVKSNIGAFLAGRAVLYVNQASLSADIILAPAARLHVCLRFYSFLRQGLWGSVRNLAAEMRLQDRAPLFVCSHLDVHGF